MTPLRYEIKTGNVVQRNNEARSCNHCCTVKAINITYSECVFVAVKHNFFNIVKQQLATLRLIPSKHVARGIVTSF